MIEFLTNEFFIVAPLYNETYGPTVEFSITTSLSIKTGSIIFESIDLDHSKQVVFCLYGETLTFFYLKN